MQVHYLHAIGTTDDIMWPLLRKKLDVVGSALDGDLQGTATGATPRHILSGRLTEHGPALPAAGARTAGCSRRQGGSYSVPAKIGWRQRLPCS